MIVEVNPVPVVVTLPGFLTNVQVPVAGKLFSTTVPVATEHVGCVIGPIAGAVGVTGCGAITTFAEGFETHAEALATVKL